jgi:hypothetical protein
MGYSQRKPLIYKDLRQKSGRDFDVSAYAAMTYDIEQMLCRKKLFLTDFF